jgi:hypothetical protein
LIGGALRVGRGDRFDIIVRSSDVSGLREETVKVVGPFGWRLGRFLVAPK